MCGFSLMTDPGIVVIQVFWNDGCWRQLHLYQTETFNTSQVSCAPRSRNQKFKPISRLGSKAECFESISLPAHSRAQTRSCTAIKRAPPHGGNALQRFAIPWM